MKAPSEKELRYYRKYRDNPKSKTWHMVVQGSLAWGLPVALSIQFFEYLTRDEAFFSTDLLLRIVIFMIGGLGFGYFMWRGRENRYQQIKRLL